MHRVYWVLFTVLCACVVSVPSSQRFNTRKGHIGRALSKLRTSRRHSIIGASRGNHPSTDVTSGKSFPDDQLAEIYEEGSESFMNPHHLQEKIEALTDTDEHFVDYGDEDNYDSNVVQDSETYEADDVFYDDLLDSDRNIRVVGQSTESEQILGEGSDEHVEEDGEHHLDLNEAKFLDQLTESEESFDEDYDEVKEGEDEFDLDPNELHVVGQSTQSEQSLENNEDEYDGDDDDFESNPDEIHVVDHFDESEQVLEDEDGGYDEEDDGFESDPNEVHIVGQSTEIEQSLDGVDGDDDEYGGDDDDLEPNDIRGVDRSTASESSLDDDEDEYDGEDDGVDSNTENVHVAGQSVDSGELLEDVHGEEDGSDSLSNDIRILGQSSETEQVNETEHNLYDADSFDDDGEDVFEDETTDEDLEFDDEEPADFQDMMVQGQALLLGESESEQPELSKASNEREVGEEWADDELYEPLDDVKVARYQDDDVDEESFEGDLPVDGMSYDDEALAQKNFVGEEGSESNHFEDDSDESEFEDTEDIDPLEREDELSEDYQDSYKSASEYDFEEDIESFENELSSLVRQDRVNGQSALQDSHSSTYSFSAVDRELDSEREGENISDEDEDQDDVDYEVERDVDVSRTISSTSVEGQDIHPDDIYLDDDDDTDEVDHMYVRSINTQASESDPSIDIHVAERLMDDAENEEVHVDGYAFVQNADAVYDTVASDESVSDHDENVSHGSRFEASEDYLAHGETPDEETFSQDDDEYDDEESQWTARQDSDYSDEESMNDTGEDEDVENPADVHWNEYVLGLASSHQEQEMKNLYASRSSEHELSNSPNNYGDGAERAVHHQNERYKINEDFGVNSHSHSILQDSVKSMAV